MNSQALVHCRVSSDYRHIMSDREMVNFVSITDSYYNLPMVVEVQRMINRAGRREQRRLRGNRKHKGIGGIKLVCLSLPY